MKQIFSSHPPTYINILDYDNLKFVTILLKKFFEGRQAKLIEKIISEFARENNLIYGIYGENNLTDLTLPYTPFVKYSSDFRTNPKLTMPNLKSIIVFGRSYGKKIGFENDNLLRANFSISAIEPDYHLVLKKLLQRLADKINFQFEYKIFVDTGPLNERLLAYKSGLGFVGKNQCIINDKFGSMFFIGYMMTNLNLKPTSLLKKNFCGACRKCIDACPSKALSENRFDYRKCISYLTQKSEKLSPDDIKIIGKQIYGCDVCQIVCPFNKMDNGKIIDINEKMPLIEEILLMSNKKLRAKYKNTTAGWKSNLFKRNAIVALINSGKLKEFMERPNLKLIIESEMKKWDIGIVED